MPELSEAITALSLDTPALPLHDSIISKSETRLDRSTLISQTCNANAASRTPTVQYDGLYAGTGALSAPAETQGGEIAMLTEKEPITQENLRRRFPNAKIIGDLDGDSTWIT